MKNTKFVSKQVKAAAEVAIKNVAEEAKKLLQKDRADRIEKCTVDINKILEKYNCVLFPEMTINEHGNFPVVRVLVKAEPNQPK